MKSRSYGQYCGLAHALDVVGERWSLLVIRELMTGPKRFKDLLLRLPGISTNLLTRRLKHLKAHGLIESRALAPPASTVAYALTYRGLELQPVLITLTRWGYRRMPPLGDRTVSLSGCALMAMQARFRVDPSLAVSDELEFRLDSEVFHVRIHDRRLEPGLGPGARPDCVLTLNDETFLAILVGTMRLHDARRSGRLTIIGDMDVYHRSAYLLDLMPLRKGAPQDLPTLDLTGRIAPRPRRL